VVGCTLSLGLHGLQGFVLEILQGFVVVACADCPDRAAEAAASNPGAPVGLSPVVQRPAGWELVLSAHGQSFFQRLLLPAFFLGACP